MSIEARAVQGKHKHEEEPLTIIFSERSSGKIINIAEFAEKVVINNSSIL